tara:strand:+ start:11096 stop:12283 length:1188 start_codon:yes stop_codon:yes gene_type:complete
MLFQTFDDKKDCLAIYACGKLYTKKLPKKDLSLTWDYSESVRGESIEYAKYYCGGKSLSEVCPSYLLKDWEGINNKLKAFHTAAKEAKLDLNQYCYFDLLPEHILLEYGKIKNQISAYVFKKYEKPEDYDFKVNLAKVLTEIKNTKLNIDESRLKPRRHEFRVRMFLKKLQRVEPYVVYQMDGTKTGRLTTSQFPILTLDKSYRKILSPKNHWFMELDYNAAELRVILSLLGKEQPKDDIHEWNLKNIFRNIGTRATAKKRVFAWLYNPESKDYLLNRAYDRDSVLQKHFNGSQVTTFYNRTIDSDGHHALNYIIQSTAADLFLRQMIKVWDFLKDKKSNIAFCLHDSLVVDLHEEEEVHVNQIKNIFSETELGTFKVNSFGGKNFGEMKRLNII